MMQNFGPLNHDDMPCIAGILDQSLDYNKVIELKNSGVRILEIRIDSFESPDVGIIYLKSLWDNPDIRKNFALLATHRENNENKGHRLAVFEEALKFADAIDVEFECDEKAVLIDMAKQRQKSSILSSHDFQKTPDIQELDTILEESLLIGANICKLAVYANSSEDMLQLMDFTQKNKNHNLVSISMGDFGLISRVLALFYGSLFTYGYIQTPNAPGQLSIFELHKLLLRFYPEYKKPV